MKRKQSFRNFEKCYSLVKDPKFTFYIYCWVNKESAFKIT